MTHPAGSEADDILERLAPGQHLDLVDETKVDGQFHMRAVVDLPDAGPQPRIVVRVFSEATDLTADAVEALRTRAGQLRVGFGLYQPFGSPSSEPLEGGEPGPRTATPDPGELLVEAELTNPADDPFIARLIDRISILSVANLHLNKGDSVTILLNGLQYARICVQTGMAQLCVAGGGCATAGAGHCTNWVRGNRMTVTGEVDNTNCTFYASGK